MNNFYKKLTQLDIFVENLNRKIARLLGKRGHKIRPPKATSNLMFWLIMAIVIVFLWASTGVYYLRDGLYGVILYRGKFSQVVKGVKIGITLPYPFARVIVIDAEPSYLQYLAEDGATHTEYKATLADLRTFFVQAQFSYQVVDPEKFYLQYLAAQRRRFNLHLQDRLRDEIRQNIKKSVNQYLIADSYHNVVNKNLTVMSNEIKDTVNQITNRYGIKVVKLNIIKVTLVPSIATATSNQTSPSVSAVSIVDNNLNNTSTLTNVRKSERKVIRERIINRE